MCVCIIWNVFALAYILVYKPSINQKKTKLIHVSTTRYIKYFLIKSHHLFLGCNKRLKKPEGQSIMDIPEKLVA